VSKRVSSKYRAGPRNCSDWIKVKNPAAPAVRRGGRGVGHATIVTNGSPSHRREVLN
jgi:ATP-dependent DNA ligase